MKSTKDFLNLLGTHELEHLAFAERRTPREKCLEQAAQFLDERGFFIVKRGDDLILKNAEGKAVCRIFPSDGSYITRLNMERSYDFGFLNMLLR